MGQLIHKTDAQLRTDVERELAWDTRVAAGAVAVAVDRGVVTLTGTVDSYAHKVAAQEAAHRVAGVHDVANDLSVRLAGEPGRTDTELAHAVRDALVWDVYVPHDRIQTTVADGVVTLAGKVAFLSQREDAIRAVRNLAGVRAVVDRIVIEAEPVSAADLREAIAGALERHAEHVARHVHLDVEGSRVIVSGVVKSWAERRAVIGAATGTPGVTEVDDRLRVQP